MNHQRIAVSKVPKKVISEGNTLTNLKNGKIEEGKRRKLVCTGFLLNKSFYNIFILKTYPKFELKKYII